MGQPSVGLSTLVDVAAFQSLMDDFYRLAGVPMAILDIEGRVLVGVGWQDICTTFHRVHPDACRHCIESDTELSDGVPSPFSHPVLLTFLRVSKNNRMLTLSAVLA